MTGLQLYHDSKLPLPENCLMKEESRQIVWAAMQRKINSHRKGFAGDRIKEMINAAHIDCGSNLQRPDLEILMTRVINDVFCDFSFMSLEELSMSIRMLVRGQLGEFHGLSVKEIYRGITVFLAKKPTAMSEYKKYMLLEESKGPTEEEKQKAKNDCIKNFIESHNLFVTSDTYKFFDYGNIIYDYLDSLGLITFTSEIKKQFMGHARHLLKVQYASERAENYQQSIDFAHTTKKILSGDDPKTEAMIVCDAKRLALKQFQIDCKDMEVSIEELIKEKQST